MTFLFEGSVMAVYREGSVMRLPSLHCPQGPCSGPIQWARGGCGADAPPLAARPELFLVGSNKSV